MDWKAPVTETEEAKATDYLAKTVLEETPLERPIGFVTERLVPRYPPDYSPEPIYGAKLDTTDPVHIRVTKDGSDTQYELIAQPGPITRVQIIEAIRQFASALRY